MKKKILAILMTVSILLCMSIGMTTVSAAENVTVVLDGKTIVFDVAPRLIGGRTMVPLRAIFEALGATVEWDDPTQTVFAYNEVSTVKCTIGSNTMYVNNVAKTIDVPPMLVDSRTLVPARFIAEGFNCDVQWEAETMTVIITSSSTDYTTVEPSGSTPAVSGNIGTLENPYSALDSAAIEYHRWSHVSAKNVAISCTNVIRGAQANALAQAENMFNDEPAANQEWIFMEFNVGYLSSTGGIEDVLEGSDILFEDTFFTTSGAAVPVHDMATLGDTYSGHGIFDVQLYPGASSKVVIGILTDAGLGDILLRIPCNGGDSNSWINCTNGVASGAVSAAIPTPPAAGGAIGTRTNPYPALNDAAIEYHRWSHVSGRNVAISCTNVIRGEQANALAHSENMFNAEPTSDQEWIFMEFNVSYLSSHDGSNEVLEGSDVIFEDTFFTTSGASVPVKDTATLGDTYDGYGIFDAELYPGASAKVVFGILTDKNLGDILLRVPGSGGASNTWINCTNGR